MFSAEILVWYVFIRSLLQQQHQVEQQRQAERRRQVEKQPQQEEQQHLAIITVRTI